MVERPLLQSRAALEAGVKPGAVAHQFGVSIARIRKLFDAI
jgi:hypothetical protein